jgi:ATP-dependent protease HslVU (ClpYQ) peptidase subunit
VTCIVGLVADGAVWLGADSAAIGGSLMGIRAPGDAKIAQVGPLLIATAGNHRAWQALRHHFEIPAHEEQHGDALGYLVHVADALRDCYRAHGVGNIGGGGEESPAVFLIGYQGRLFALYGDFSIGEFAEEYHALGAGEEVALGALYATPALRPENRLEMALEAAERFCLEVRWPFVIKKWEAPKMEIVVTQEWTEGGPRVVDTATGTPRHGTCSVSWTVDAEEGADLTIEMPAEDVCPCCGAKRE